MIVKVFVFIAIFFSFYNNDVLCRSRKFSNARARHTASEVSSRDVSKLATMTNMNHFRAVLDKILVPRVVGSPEHDAVADFIVDSMENLGWNVKRYKFRDEVPILGTLDFQNIVATLNPQADRQLILACHYDSKYMREGSFLGATDSAVPCAMMINLAYVMKNILETSKDRNDISLTFVFFDGEEAFQSWTATDSIYGARNLAANWEKKKFRSQLDSNENVTELDRIDLLVLLDLLGAKNPKIYSYFSDTNKWFTLLTNIEEQLSEMGKLKRHERYFIPYHYPANIEDDHIPFLHKGVPILHIIPSPFPSVWHKSSDNLSAVDMNTVENLNKIFRVFVAQYLNLQI